MENLHPALQPVSPNKCALALAIPLSREQFLADLSQADEKDFVHHFRAGRGLEKADAEFCWEVYEDEEATLVKAVCFGVERLGVTVHYETRLADLTDLLNRFPVVTLVAHWRFVPVERGDIRDAPQLLDLLQSPRSRVPQSIRQAFEMLDPELLRPGTYTRLSGMELCQRVVEVINTVANKAESLYWGESGSQSFEPELMSEGLIGGLTRLEFERAFPDLIAPARVIEFCDGMHTVPELVESVPEKFAGLLDLTVCNSVIPASAIRISRQSCLVAGNRKPAELRARMYLYGLEISLLAKQPRPFVEVIKQVHLGKPEYKIKGGRLWKLFGKFFNNTRGRR